MTKWRDLKPDPAMVAALDAAGERPENGADDKRNWGNRFADACAVMFANAVRSHPVFSKFEIRPNPDGTGRESLTGVGGGKKKKVDVIVSTLATGLQVAISLKAENFAHHKDGYGKNTLNRIYELQDEVRAVHDYQPRAYVVGVFFMPLGGTADKPNHSSFARCVAQLRARSGRSDFASPSQLNKLDWSVVGLYLHDKEQRGAVRYFDVSEAPPRTGRPVISSTLTLKEVIDRIAEKYQRDAGDLIDYADPEED